MGDHEREGECKCAVGEAAGEGVNRARFWAIEAERKPLKSVGVGWMMN